MSNTDNYYEKKLLNLVEFKEQRELLKKETEEIMNKTNLSSHMKENYIDSLSYKQKDMRIKGGVGKFSSLTLSEEMTPSYKNQQKELYKFDNKFYDFRLDDWEVERLGKDTTHDYYDRYYDRKRSPDFDVLIKIPNNLHKKEEYYFDSFFEGRIVSTKSYPNKFEDRFDGRFNSEEKEFNHSTFGENVTHWFVSHSVPNYVFNHKTESKFNNRPSWIRNDEMWIECKEISCFTDDILKSLDEWVIQYNSPEKQMVMKYTREDQLDHETNKKIDEYIEKNLQHPPSYQELMSQFFDTNS